MAWSENARFRVLHVIPSIGPLRGGPSVAVRTMAEGLASHGLTVDVVTTDDNGPQRLAVPLGRPVLHNGVTYRYFPRQIKFYTVSWALLKWLVLNLRKYDAVHIHGLFSFASTAGALCAAYYDVPYVVRPLGVLNAWGIRNRRPFLKKLSLNLLETFSTPLYHHGNSSSILVRDPEQFITTVYTIHKTFRRHQQKGSEH